jgi:long-chain acyl-CoA synthetase
MVKDKRRTGLGGIMNLANNLERSAFYFPDRPAVVEGDREISYREFNQESNHVATALIGLEIKSGDPVALCAPSSYQWLTCYFGILKAGAIAVTLPSTVTGGGTNPIIE